MTKDKKYIYFCKVFLENPVLLVQIKSFSVGYLSLFTDRLPPLLTIGYLLYQPVGIKLHCATNMTDVYFFFNKGNRFPKISRNSENFTRFSGKLGLFG